MALEQAVALHQAILASALDPIVTIDPHGVIQSASDSLERVLGWMPLEVIGRNVSMLMSGPFRELHDGYLANYRRTGITSILGRTREFQALHKDGTLIPIELSVSRVDVPGRSEPLYTGIIRDVSERKRAENQIQLLQSLMLNISAAADLNSALLVTLREICDRTGWDYGEVWLPSREGGELVESLHWRRGPQAGHAGSHAPRMLGELTRFAPGEGLPGHVWHTKRALWIDDLADAPAKIFVRAAEARAAGLKAALGVPILAGDEVVAVLVFFVCAPRVGDSGMVNLVCAAVAPLGPVIQRKRAEEALQESERRFREMLHHTELAAVMLDPEGNITFCDEYLLRITGWKQEEILGRNWFELFIPAEVRHEVMQVFVRGVTEGRIAPHYENEILTRDGGRLLIAWSNTLIRDVQGKVIGATGLGLDITERRRLEDELTQHRHHLEELVKERTGQLEATHHQLRQADRLASIGTLAAGLGHDMNNVLLPIRARLDALDAAQLPPKAKEQFQAVRRSIGYLQQLSDGLHLLALDPDDPDASSGVTVLGEWWNQVGPLLLKAVPRRIAFHSDFPENLPPIAVAPHRLTQAVLNLVVNAGEAIHDQGMVRVWAAPPKPPDDQFVCLGVTDSGEGMPPEVIKQAMDPFFTTKKRGLGTGLGLSLVRGVAQSAGGGVGIESQLGKGTTVTLKLPVATRPDGKTHDDAAKTAVVSIKDRRAATFVSALLSAAGFTVRFADLGAADSAPPPHSRIWIAEPQMASTQQARQYLRSDRRRRVIIFGRALADWAAFVGGGVSVIDNPDDFDLIRRTIGQTLLAPTGNSP